MSWICLPFLRRLIDNEYNKSKEISSVYFFQYFGWLRWVQRNSLDEFVFSFHFLSVSMMSCELKSLWDIYSWVNWTVQVARQIRQNQSRWLLIEFFLGEESEQIASTYNSWNWFFLLGWRSSLTRCLGSETFLWVCILSQSLCLSISCSSTWDGTRTLRRNSETRPTLWIRKCFLTSTVFEFELSTQFAKVLLLFIKSLL